MKIARYKRNGKYIVLSKTHRLVKFSSQPQYFNGDGFDPSWDSIEEIFVSMQESNFEYGITVEFPKYTGKGIEILLEAKNPQAFAELYPEFFI